MNKVKSQAATIIRKLALAFRNRSHGWRRPCTIHDVLLHGWRKARANFRLHPRHRNRQLSQFIITLLLLPGTLFAQDLTLVLTTNLEGNFSPQIENQEKNDPLILLGQSIEAEKRKTPLLWLDLGNAFYPGVLSKYSGGRAMIDFFNAFQCRSTLVSSKDLRIGADSLEFLQKKSQAALLSGNIINENKSGKKNPFKPYFIHQGGAEKIAFIALSSNKILFNIAEKDVFKIRLEQQEKALAKILEELKNKGISRRILLSGLEYSENITLINKFKEIDLVICGGDNQGKVLEGKILRMDLEGGRSIISLTAPAEYYLLHLSLGQNFGIVQITPKKTKNYADIKTDRYRDFIKRITIWKKQSGDAAGRIIAKTEGKTFEIDYKKIARLFRHRYNGEAAIIKKDAIRSFKEKENIKRISLLSSINDNYTVFVYKLTGSQLQTVHGALPEFYFDGYENSKIQDYALTSSRFYSIVSTQSVFERVETILGTTVPYENTWKDIPELITEDLTGKEEKVLYRKDFDYLDGRFRSTIDIFLSGFYENSYVKKGDSISAPAGQASESFKKWGTESKIDLTIYNDLHKIVITPYINYAKQEDIYLNNLLRGTLFYKLNIDFPAAPYHKSQVDSVVAEVEGLRPTLIRETLGSDIETEYITGKIGIGFEKKVHDPVEDAIYGFETILKFNIDFLSYFSYSLNLDSFLSLTSSEEESSSGGYIKTDIENALSFKVSELIKLSFKHKWYHYYSIKLEEHYYNSRFITSLDLKTDFKLY
ncbi:MAG: hypothetical protein GY754_47070 [bacterium]|nr:hypothetical protein [bacterium]